jgi:hypothetical protein
MIMGAPWYLQNMVIRRDLQTPTVKEEIPHCSSQHSVRLSAHPNDPILRDNIDSIKKNTETLIDARKKVGLERNVEKTKCILLPHHQNVGRNRDIKIANTSFGNVSQFKYSGTTVTNQNLIQEEIKGRLNSGNACYHSV